MSLWHLNDTVSRWAILFVLFLTGYLNKFLKMLGLNYESSKRLQSVGESFEDLTWSMNLAFFRFLFPLFLCLFFFLFLYFPWWILRRRTIERGYLSTILRSMSDVSSVEGNRAIVQQRVFLSDNGLIFRGYFLS